MITELVKELNGVGELNSNVMSETWSSRVATSLSEHEQMQEIANMPEFDLEAYGDGDDGGSLGGSFRAVIEFMKSRSFRKVNREVYVVKQGGYDHHRANEVDLLFETADNALEDFVAELKTQGLWESTVIVMGSDFGRSMNPNSECKQLKLLSSLWLPTHHLFPLVRQWGFRPRLGWQLFHGRGQCKGRTNLGQISPADEP
jgi:hypothetical protein